MTANELLASLMPRLERLPEASGLSFIVSLNRAIDMIFNRMWMKGSEMGKKMFDGLTIDSSVPVDLPSDFRGLVCNILSIEGEWASDYTINPLPFGYLINNKISQPIYYYITGENKIGLSPSPDQSYIVNGWYYAAPISLALTDTIPWKGIFDIIIGDIVLMLIAGQVDEMTVNGMIDRILFQRQTSPNITKAQ